MRCFAAMHKACMVPQQPPFIESRAWDPALLSQAGADSPGEGGRSRSLQSLRQKRERGGRGGGAG